MDITFSPAEVGPADRSPTRLHVGDVRTGEIRSRVIQSDDPLPTAEPEGVADVRVRGDVVVVLDPVDGSTNASKGIPWFATSLCALDAGGPLASVVVNPDVGETVMPKVSSSVLLSDTSATAMPLYAGSALLAAPVWIW